MSISSNRKLDNYAWKKYRNGKQLVSGSSKEEIETILDENIGSNNFDFVISGDDLKEGQGKPDPASFQTALQRMNLTPSEAIVVENSPLGIEAANKAGIPYMVTVNNTPLEISDFGSLLEGDTLNNRIFKDTKVDKLNNRIFQRLQGIS